MKSRIIGCYPDRLPVAVRHPDGDKILSPRDVGPIGRTEVTGIDYRGRSGFTFRRNSLTPQKDEGIGAKYAAQLPVAHPQIIDVGEREGYVGLTGSYTEVMSMIRIGAGRDWRRQDDVRPSGGTR